MKTNKKKAVEKKVNAPKKEKDKDIHAYSYRVVSVQTYPTITLFDDRVEVELDEFKKIAVIKYQKNENSEKGFLIRATRIDAELAKNIAAGTMKTCDQVSKDDTTITTLAISKEAVEGVVIAYMKQISAEDKLKLLSRVFNERTLTWLKYEKL